MVSSRYQESPLGPHVNQGAKVVHWFHRLLLSLSERKTCDAIVLWILHYRIDSLHLYIFFLVDSPYIFYTCWGLPPWRWHIPKVDQRSTALIHAISFFVRQGKVKKDRAKMWWRNLRTLIRRLRSEAPSCTFVPQKLTPEVGEKTFGRWTEGWGAKPRLSPPGRQDSKLKVEGQEEDRVGSVIQNRSVEIGHSNLKK